MTPDTRESLQGRDILVVDDNPANRQILTALLGANGYTTRVADSGQAALDAVRQRRPDLVLMDVQMPDVDGFAVCRRLKSDPQTQDVPVIFITASDTVDSKIEGFNAGGADYIPRPIQLPEVLLRVRNQLTVALFQRKTEAERERLERIFSALPVPYLLCRLPDGEIVGVNQQAQELMALAHPATGGRLAPDTFSEPDGRPLRLRELEDARDRELTLLSRDGRAMTVLLSATRVALKEETLFIAFNDITERKAMEQTLERLAETDPLTGIFNRRAFSERASEERSRCSRSQKPLCMVMFDIDHFKSINDTHGHDAGDRALQVTVELLEEGLRASDTAGRLGGEEFAVILPETDLEGARRLTERIRHRIQDYVFDADATPWSVTISGGLALWEPDMSYEEVFKVADERLYEAKQSGRNRVVSES